MAQRVNAPAEGQKKGINLRAAEFEAALFQLVNVSELPACVVRLTVEKLLDRVTAAENKVLREELEAAKPTPEVNNDGGQTNP